LNREEKQGGLFRRRDTHLLNLLVKSDMAYLTTFMPVFYYIRRELKSALKIFSGSLNGGCCTGTTGEPEGVVK